MVFQRTDFVAQQLHFFGLVGRGGFRSAPAARDAQQVVVHLHAQLCGPVEVDEPFFAGLPSDVLVGGNEVHAFDGFFFLQSRLHGRIAVEAARHERQAAGTEHARQVVDLYAVVLIGQAGEAHGVGAVADADVQGIIPLPQGGEGQRVGEPAAAGEFERGVAAFEYGPSRCFGTGDDDRCDAVALGKVVHAGLHFGLRRRSGSGGRGRRQDGERSTEQSFFHGWSLGFMVFLWNVASFAAR